VLIDKRWMRVEVLEKRECETFPNIVADCQKEQTAAIETKLPHGFGLSTLAREQKVGFSFSLFGVKKTHWLPVLERINSSLNFILHGACSTEGVHEGSYAFTISRGHEITRFCGQPTERDYHRMALGLNLRGCQVCQ